MRALPRRFLSALRWLRTAWLIVGLTLLLIAIGELGLRGLFALRDQGLPMIPPDPRVLAAIEGSADWLPVHYRELEAISDRWQPYVYFRQRPFQGQTITIGADGLRATWKPASRDTSSAEKSTTLKLLFLGGSSLWGYGARDHKTIPSFIAQGLEKRGVAVEVRNLAEIGYVSTQELIGLTRELQAGYRPDVVLFYDGVNDTTSAMLERTPGVTTNEINREREFNLLQSPSRLAVALVGNLVMNSAWYRLAASINRRFRQGPIADARSPAESEVQPLAHSIVERYVANIRLIKALSTAYGFQPLFVWQPVIYGKSRLVPFEHEEAEKYGWTRAMFQQVRQEIKGHDKLSSDSAFCDLSAIFEKEESLIFLDFCHTTEAANERIASLLVDKLMAIAADSKFSRINVRGF